MREPIPIVSSASQLLLLSISTLDTLGKERKSLAVGRWSHTPHRPTDRTRLLKFLWALSGPRFSYSSLSLFMYYTYSGRALACNSSLGQPPNSMVGRSLPFAAVLRGSRTGSSDFREFMAQFRDLNRTPRCCFNSLTFVFLFPRRNSPLRASARWSSATRTSRAASSTRGRSLTTRRQSASRTERTSWTPSTTRLRRTSSCSAPQPLRTSYRLAPKAALSSCR